MPDAAPWQLQPGVPQLLEGSQHAPTDLLRWRVDLGAACEVAVADVSFMAMAGAPGASRALSTTIGRLIEPFTRPLNEREKEIAPREATMSQLSRERERERTRGAKRRAKSKITSVFLMVLIFLIFLIFLVFLIVIVAASEVRCF